MRKCILICCMLTLLLSACGSKKEFEPEIFFHYSSEMLSLVDQRNSDYFKDEGVLYTLTLTDFRPQEPVFQKFVHSYSGDGRDGFIVITKRTKLYTQFKGANTKTSIPISALYDVIVPVGSERYPKVEFWVTPFKKNEYEVEAMEVVLLVE